MTGRRPRILTEKDVAAIRLMRQNGFSWERIAARFRTRYEVVRKAVDLEYAERRRRSVNTAKKRHRDKAQYSAIRTDDGAVMFNTGRRPDVPTQVLLERERAQQIERTITQRLCGDPLPGRSALDRQRLLSAD